MSHPLVRAYVKLIRETQQEYRKSAKEVGSITMSTKCILEMRADFDINKGVTIGGKVYTVTIPGEPIGAEISGGYESKSTLDSDGKITFETTIVNREEP
jgi:hypothetical protein